MSAAAEQVSVLKVPPDLTALERTLLNDFQRDLPLCANPFDEIARVCGVSTRAVLQTLRSLQRRGLVSRVGPVFAPRRAGASTLAALAVPHADLEEVAACVNSFTEVNHNYQREHAFNLWFVVTAPDQEHVQSVLATIEARTGLPVLDLPLQRSFFIDLGFPLWC
jgi:DNA-binding Lrp family transcriptional regulator